MVKKKKHSLALTDPSITSASRLYDRFPRERAGGGGDRGHSREVWVELCLRGEIVHFATQFKTLFHDPELFRLAYRIEYFFFNTYIKELDFLKEIVGSTHVDRSSPTFTLF